MIVDVGHVSPLISFVMSERLSAPLKASAASDRDAKRRQSPPRRRTSQAFRSPVMLLPARGGDPDRFPRPGRGDDATPALWARSFLRKSSGVS